GELTSCPASAERRPPAAWKPPLPVKTGDSIFPLLVPFPRQCCRNAGLPATNCGSHDQREVKQRHHSQPGYWLIPQLECDENEKLKNWTGPTLPRSEEHTSELQSRGH